MKFNGLYLILLVVLTSCSCKDRDCPTTDFGDYQHYPTNQVEFDNAFGDSITIELKKSKYIQPNARGGKFGECRPCEANFNQHGTFMLNGVEQDFKSEIMFLGNPGREMVLEDYILKFGGYTISIGNHGGISTHSYEELGDYEELGTFELREDEFVEECHRFNYYQEDIKDVVFSKTQGLVEFSLKDITWKRVF